MAGTTSETSRPTVLVTWPGFEEDFPHAVVALRDAGAAVRLAPRLGNRTPGELSTLLGGVVGAIVSTDPFTSEVISAHPELQVIARVGVGFDSIDISVATSRGILVTTTKGANETTVADHTIALMLAAARRISEHDRNVKDRQWLRTGPLTSWLLTGSTVGLVGYGVIGRLVAKRLKGFDVRILVSDPAFAGDAEVEAVALDELLAQSDFVSMHTPLLSSTRGLISAREISLMKESAILINTGRGGIVDESELAGALREGHLRYAGLDVFELEPPVASPLLDLPNTVLTPHIAGVSDISATEMVERAVNSILDTLAGRVPPNVVNGDAVESWRTRHGVANV